MRTALETSHSFNSQVDVQHFWPSAFLCVWFKKVKISCHTDCESRLSYFVKFLHFSLLVFFLCITRTLSFPLHIPIKHLFDSTRGETITHLDILFKQPDKIIDATNVEAWSQIKKKTTHSHEITGAAATCNQSRCTTFSYTNSRQCCDTPQADGSFKRTMWWNSSLCGD